MKKFLPTPNSTVSASSSIAEMTLAKARSCLNRSYKNIRALLYSLHTAAPQRKRLLCCKSIQILSATPQWQVRKRYHALQQQVFAGASYTAAIFRYRIGVPYILNMTRQKRNSNSFCMQHFNRLTGKSIMEGGLPFEVKQPRFNAETKAAIEEARRIIAGEIPAKRYGSVRDLFNELDKEITAE